MLHTQAAMVSSFFRNHYGDNAQYLISPELEVAATGVVVQFYYKSYNTHLEKFKVGYSTTDTQISSFTFGPEISTNNTSWTLSDEFVFPAGTKYVAVHYCSVNQCYLYVDDFSFTAGPACPAPTALAATPYARSAQLVWTGSSESYTVLYRQPPYYEGGLYEPFDKNVIPAGWTRYEDLVDDVLAGTAVLASTTENWKTTDQALGAYNMKINIYGTGRKHWLVTPGG